MQPYKLDFSQRTAVVKDSVEFVLENTSDRHVTIDVVDCRSDLFTLSVPGTVPAHGSVNCIMRLTPESVAQEFGRSITLRATGIIGQHFTIPVKRTITAD